MKLFSLFSSKKLDAVSAEELADVLIAGDVAPDVATDIVKRVKAGGDTRAALRDVLLQYAKKLEKCGVWSVECGIGNRENRSTITTNNAPSAETSINSTLHTPHSTLIVGVNGAGKTTTVGKLAKMFADSGARVVIGACDTFRAAANEQLDIWAARAGARIIHGSEPAAVAYKTLEEVRGLRVEDGGVHADTSTLDPQPSILALLDTAGRLHNRQDLMDELSKIVRVMKKLDADAPNEAWLVLDGTTGQNALAQIEYFARAVPLSGLIVTKMDGTSKGGFLISYAAREKSPLPVVYMGYGEKIEDLRPFSAKEYVDRLLG